MTTLIGERIRRLRDERELTQAEFGKLFGVAANTVSQWENRVNEPDAEVLVRIAEQFKVSVDWLIGRTDAREGKVTPRPDLSQRWPDLSPDRREKALHLERITTAIHIPPRMNNEDFDLLFDLVTAHVTAFIKAQMKRAPSQQ